MAALERRLQKYIDEKFVQRQIDERFEELMHENGITRDNMPDTVASVIIKAKYTVIIIYKL